MEYQNFILFCIFLFMFNTEYKTLCKINEANDSVTFRIGIEENNYNK